MCRFPSSNLFALLGLIFASGVCTATAASTPPNVLMIAVDDLNDWIGCMRGRPSALTPNIDQLAARGTLFANAHCQAPKDQPFFIATGFRLPHVPCFASQKWLDLYPEDKLGDPRHADSRARRRRLALGRRDDQAGGIGSLIRCSRTH